MLVMHRTFSTECDVFVLRRASCSPRWSCDVQVIDDDQDEEENKAPEPAGTLTATGASAVASALSAISSAGRALASAEAAVGSATGRETAAASAAPMEPIVRARAVSLSSCPGHMRVLAMFPCMLLHTRPTAHVCMAV